MANQWFTRGLGVVCATALLGCGDDTPANTTGTSSDSSATQSTVTTPSTGETTTTTTGEPPTTGEPATGTSTTAACIDPNACGGCVPLPDVPGAACNGCDGTQWACDGLDALVCQGSDPDAKPYYPDADGDGFGDVDAAPTLSCVPVDGHVPGDNTDCNDADPGANPNGKETCNGVDDDCNNALDEAPPSSFCSDVCCDVEKLCDGVACVDKCPGGEICGPDLELCCEGGTSCVGNTCVTPGDSCEFDEQCAADEICPVYLGKCVPDDVLPMCEYIPTFGAFQPVQACRWTTAGVATDPGRGDVVATPIVLNLSDDNADGKTDDLDTPDIAFMTYNFGVDGCCNSNGTLRVVSGQCNGDKSMKTLASINSPTLTNDVGIAGGDLDNDGVPELVAVTKVNNTVRGTAAFSRVTADGTEWKLLWHNQVNPTTDQTRGGPTVSLADLEGDGKPEVVIGNVVLDGLTGALVWDGSVTSMGTGGVGNNGFLGPASTVADIDLDGQQEVLAGNTAYRSDGSVLWTYAYVGNNSSCGGAIACDGFNAVANLDADDEAEVVIVRLGEIFVLDTDGSQLHRIKLPKIDCAGNESGPPTVADFDGDGKREIGTASADYYMVADLDCDADPIPMGCADKGILWKVPNEDCSSRVTASSVFDFEGDGKAEVIYADEIHFRIFDGSTGAVLFSDNTFRSHTRIEMPVIADVNRDGHADIVLGENSYNGGMPGLEVWSGAQNDWVRTRRVWNQHAYHITNTVRLS